MVKRKKKKRYLSRVKFNIFGHKHCKSRVFLTIGHKFHKSRADH